MIPAQAEIGGERRVRLEPPVDVGASLLTRRAQS